MGWVTLDNPNDVKRHLVTVASFPLALAGIAEVISARSRQQPGYQCTAQAGWLGGSYFEATLRVIGGVVTGPPHCSDPPTLVQVRSFCCSTNTVRSRASARIVTCSGSPGWEMLKAQVSMPVLVPRTAAGGAVGVGVSETGAPGCTDFMGTGGP